MTITTFDSKIFAFFTSGFNGAVDPAFGSFLFALCSLALATFLSFFLGYERERYGHAAGLRTHMLVAVASSLIMYLSIFGFPSSFTNRDPARLAAQAVSGIGFLGAGTIIQNGIDVKGLTTATTLWIAMAIGLACGSGNFIIAVMATVVAFFSLVSVKRIEKRFNRRNPILTIVVSPDKFNMEAILAIAHRYQVSIRNSNTQMIQFDGNPALRIELHCNYATAKIMNAFQEEISFSMHPLDIDLKVMR